MTCVLDAHALLVYLEREKGFEAVKSLLAQALENEEALLMTTVNVGEILYITLRERGQKKMQEIDQIIQNLPIDIADVDMRLTQEAVQFKAHKKMSYADCFAAALAKYHQVPIVTGDPEFKEVASEIDVHWL